MAFRPLTDHEVRYREEGGSFTSPIAMTLDNSTDLGGGQYRFNEVPDANIAIGDFQTRVMAKDGNPPSAWLSNTVAFTAGSYVPEELGVIYDKSSWADFEDFDLGFVIDSDPYINWSIVGGKIRSDLNTVGLSPDVRDLTVGWLNFLMLKSIPTTSDNTLTIEVEMKPYSREQLGDSNSQVGRFVIVKDGINPVSVSSLAFECYINSPSLNGTFFSSFRRTHNAEIYDEILSNRAITLGSDIFTMNSEGFISSYDMTGNLTNVTKATQDDFVDQDGTNFNGYDLKIVPSRDYATTIAITAWDINRIKVTSNMLKNPQILGVGDSKTASPLGGSDANRYIDILAGLMGKSFWVYGGQSNRTIETNKIMSYLIAQDVKADIITLNIGRNDIAFDTEGDFDSAQYSEIVTKLKTRLNPGGKFIHILPLLEGEGDGAVSDQTVINDYINSTYPSDYKYDPVAYGWNHVTMTNDKVHPNLLGANNIANGLQTFINSL